MFRLVFILELFPHSKHVLLGDDKIVEVLNNFENKFFVLKFLSDAIAYAFAEFICLQNIAELFKNSL